MILLTGLFDNVNILFSHAPTLSFARFLGRLQEHAKCGETGADGGEGGEFGERRVHLGRRTRHLHRRCHRASRHHQGRRQNRSIPTQKRLEIY